MRRLRVTFILIVTVLALALGYHMRGRGAQAKNVRLHAKDLPENNLLIMAPTSPSFGDEVSRLKAGKDDKQQRLIEGLKPFSVFIKNTGHRDVVAYRLRWDVMQPDGTVITHLRTYSEPGALMGRETHRMSESSRNAGVSIRANSGRYVSVAFSVSQSPGAETPLSFGSSSSSTGDITQIQQIAAERDETALTDLLGSQLERAASLTVSLDAAVFDDGTFVGSDSFGYFAQLQAAVRAKRELLQRSLHAVQQNKPIDQVFEDVAALAREPDVAIKQNSTHEDYYRFYRKEFAGEIARLRASVGDDKKAMWYAVYPLRRPWLRLRKQQ